MRYGRSDRKIGPLFFVAVLWRGGIGVRSGSADAAGRRCPETASSRYRSVGGAACDGAGRHRRVCGVSAACLRCVAACLRAVSGRWVARGIGGRAAERGRTRPDRRWDAGAMGRSDVAERSCRGRVGTFCGPNRTGFGSGKNTARSLRVGGMNIFSYFCTETDKYIELWSMPTS